MGQRGQSIWWRQIIRTLLGTVAFIALVVMTLGGPARASGVVGAIRVRWIAAVIFVVGSALLLRLGRLSKIGHPPSPPIGPEEAQSPNIVEITDAERQVSRKYKTEVLVLFNRLLQGPERYLTRIAQKVEPREGCLRLDVVMDFAFNDSTTQKIQNTGEQIILLPLIKLEKGVMLDNFEILDSAGERVPALLQEEANGLIAYAITKLFRLAFIGDSADSIGRELTDAEESLRWSLVNLACHVDRVELGAKNAVLSILEPIPGALKVADKEGLKTLRAFCDFCADHYFIIVEAVLPRGSRMTMRYTRTVPEYGRTTDWNDRMRVRLGLSPYKYLVPLELAFDAPSYHFSMLGVQGQYLAHQALVDPGTMRPIEPSRFSQAPLPPTLHSRHGSGLPYAHLYTRRLDRIPVINMATRVEFSEIPPGALGGAFVVAAACAVLVWFFTLTQPGLHKTINITSDLPALLLTVPAFAATWIGQSVDRILRSSLAAYVGLAISAIISIASSLLYIANASHRSFFTISRISFDHDLVHLTDIDVSWLVLAFAASLASAYLAEQLRDKVKSYMRAVKNGSQLN